LSRVWKFTLNLEEDVRAGWAQGRRHAGVGGRKQERSRAKEQLRTGKKGKKDGGKEGGGYP